MKSITASTGPKRECTGTRHAGRRNLQGSIIPRSTGQPVSIGYLLEPVREIAGHPDRNRLLSELFNG